MSSKDLSDGDGPAFVENVESASYEKNIDQNEEEFDQPFHFTLSHFLTIIVLFSGYLADTFSANLAHGIYSLIDDDIGPAPNNFYWLLTVPTVAGGVLAPVFGRISDLFGRKNIQLVASLFGIAGAALSARAGSMKVLLAASGLCSVAYAGHEVSLSAIVELFPRKWRAIIIGLYIGAKIPADGFAPLIGAAIQLHSSWRVIYWLALGLYIFSFVGILLFYHPEPLDIQRNESLSSRVRHFDYIGAFLLISAITTTAIGVIFGGLVFKWISVGVLLPTFLGLVMVAVLVAWVRMNKLRHPLVPKTLNIHFWLLWGCVFFIGMCCSTTNGLWPTHAQILYAHGPISLALFETAYGLTGSLCATVAGFLFFPRYARWILVCYCTILMIAVGAEAIINKNTAAASTVIAAINGAMHGATIVVTTAMVQLSVRHEDLAVSTNLIFSSFTAGGVAYGIIDQIVINNKIKPLIIKYVVPPLIQSGIPLASLLQAVPLFVAGKVDNPIFATAKPASLVAAGEGLKEVYIHIFGYVYKLSILFGGVMVLNSLGTSNITERITSKVEARLRTGSPRDLILRRRGV